MSEITLSIVSHGHTKEVEHLLAKLQVLSEQETCVLKRIIITHNLPCEAIAKSQSFACFPFEVLELHNKHPQGFGRNHNLAFLHCQTPYFAILNPDVNGFCSTFWIDLLRVFQNNSNNLDDLDHLNKTNRTDYLNNQNIKIGCVYPILLNTNKTIQDSERLIPTPFSLFKRYLLTNQNQRHQISQNNPNNQHDLKKDWVSAACWLLDSKAWKELNGFDERFFMYGEDVDFCLRLQLKGWRLARANATLIHHAERKSHRHWRYFVWHVGSLLRLWFQAPIWHYLIAKKSKNKMTK